MNPAWVCELDVNILGVCVGVGVWVCWVSYKCTRLVIYLYTILFFLCQYPFSLISGYGLWTECNGLRARLRGVKTSLFKSQSRSISRGLKPDYLTVAATPHE